MYIVCLIREELFDEETAHEWWVENYSRIMEVYSIVEYDISTSEKRKGDHGDENVIDLDIPSIGEEIKENNDSNQDQLKSKCNTMKGLAARCEDNESVQVVEWEDNDDPEVTLTTTSLPDGTRQLREVTFRYLINYICDDILLVYISILHSFEQVICLTRIKFII